MMCPVLILKINITVRVIVHKTHLPVTLMRGQVIHMKKKILLETEKTVYVEYQGIYNYYGTDLYEFRCYR